MESCLTVVLLVHGLFVATGAAAVSSKLDPPAGSQPAPRFTLDVDQLLTDPTETIAGRDPERRVLETIIEESQTPMDRAAAHLALANWLLAVPTAGPALRWLMGMSAPNDAKTLTDMATLAQTHLDRARYQLDAEPTPSSQSQPAGERDKKKAERIQQLKTVIGYLEPFAAVFVSATAGSDGKARPSAWSRAARGMAMIREADDERLAACALVWQAFAWEMAGQHERSQAALPEALRPPDEPTYGFLSRLLRCRMDADAGEYAAALALSIRIRSACPAWFPKEAKEIIQSRQRLAALLQCRIGQRWAKQLRESQKAGLAPRVEAILAQVQESLFADAHAAAPVYRPEHAIPIIAKPPKLAAMAPVGRARPSTTPSTGTAPATATNPF